MSSATEPAERGPPPSERCEPVAVADAGDGAGDAHGTDRDLLAGTDLRTLTPEALQLLAATGC